MQAVGNKSNNKHKKTWEKTNKEQTNGHSIKKGMAKQALQKGQKARLCNTKIFENKGF